MIDLHAHLLPGIDDGPGSWDDAVAMVAEAAQAGVTAMVATPHMHPDGPWANEAETVLPLVEELRRRVAGAGIAVDIYAGGEVHISHDLAQRVDKGRVLTYGGGLRYILVELPFQEVPSYFDQVIFELRLRGITPIVAHPERNAVVKRQPQMVLDWLERGALLQVNVSSLAGDGTSRAAAEALLDLDAVHFLASDAHGTGRRRPLQRSDFETVAGRWGEATARRLFCDNPAAVIAGGPLPPHVPSTRAVHTDREARRAAGGWLERLRGAIVRRPPSYR